MCISILFSSEAANFGQLLGGASTFGLLVLALFWKKQEAAEKKSQLAERLIKDLDAFHDGLFKWLKLRASWLIYNKDSSANKKKLEALPNEVEKKSFLEQMLSDSFEVTNYLKRADSLLQMLKNIKRHGKPLDSTLQSRIEALESLITEEMYNLRIYHFIDEEETSDDAKKQKIDAYKNLKVNRDQIVKNEIYFLREVLEKYYFFDY